MNIHAILKVLNWISSCNFSQECDLIFLKSSITDMQTKYNQEMMLVLHTGEYEMCLTFPCTEKFQSHTIPSNIGVFYHTFMSCWEQICSCRRTFKQKSAIFLWIFFPKYLTFTLFPTGNAYLLPFPNTKKFWMIWRSEVTKQMTKYVLLIPVVLLYLSLLLNMGTYLIWGTVVFLTAVEGCESPTNPVSYQPCADAFIS